MNRALFAVAALCLVVAAGCYRDTGEGELTVTREADRAAERASTPTPAPRKARDAELTKEYNAEVAAGRKELTRFPEAKRKKMFTEFICADRRAVNLLLQAMQNGKQKVGQSGQWAHDRYRNPLFRKYRITEKGRFALDVEGGEKNWPLPHCDPAP